MRIDPNEVVISDRIDPNEVEIIPAPTPARPPDSFGSRFVSGMADPIHGAAQIADRYLVNPIRQRISPGSSSMEDVTRQRDAEYNAPEGFDAARVAGNVANPVSWLGGGAGVLRAAGQGAFQAGLAPVNPDDDFLTEKAKQTGMGAAGGAILAKVLRGFTPTREAQALMDRGVQPSFGQSMGGMANTVEQKMTSVPFVGDAINFARNRAQKEFEAAALQRAVGGVPQQAQTIPQRFQQLFSSDRIPGTSVQVERATARSPKTLDDANAIAGQQFDAVVPFLAAKPNWASSVPGALQKSLANIELTAQNRRILNGLVAEHLDPAKLKVMTGKQLKHTDSQLGFLIRKYAAGSPADKTLADELRNVQGAFRADLNDMLPAVMTDDLRKANTTWRDLVPINKAASARADEKITPRSLQKAMASQARLPTSRMPDDMLVDNAVKVLPSNIPDSGTAGRVLLGGGVAGLAGSLPAYLGGGALAYTGATRPAQRALVGNTAWQKALSPYDAHMAAMLAAALRGQGQGNNE